jgi:hypothetical protein
MKENPLNINPPSRGVGNAYLTVFGSAVLIFLFLLTGLFFSLYYTAQKRTADQRGADILIVLPSTSGTLTEQKRIRNKLSHISGIKRYAFVDVQEVKKTLEKNIPHFAESTPTGHILKVWGSSLLSTQRLAHLLVENLKDVYPQVQALVYKMLHETNSWFGEMVEMYFILTLALIGFAVGTIFTLSVKNNIQTFAGVLHLIVLMGAPARYIRNHIRRYTERPYICGFLLAVFFTGLTLCIVNVTLGSLGLNSLLLMEDFIMLYLPFIFISGIFFYVLIRTITMWEIYRKVQSL